MNDKQRHYLLSKLLGRFFASFETIWGDSIYHIEKHDISDDDTVKSEMLGKVLRGVVSDGEERLVDDRLISMAVPIYKTIGAILEDNGVNLDEFEQDEMK